VGVPIVAVVVVLVVVGRSKQPTHDRAHSATADAPPEDRP
jgi:hypothetical protein